MSISRDNKQNEFDALQGQLLEFRDLDAKLARYAAESSQYLQLLNTESTPHASKIKTLQQYLNTIQAETNGLWQSLITKDGDLTETFRQINAALSNAENNQKFKERFIACYWITQNYLQLIPILKNLDARTASKLESSLASIFQFLPRQALLISDLLKKVQKDWPHADTTIQHLMSLNRKYKRLNVMLDQIMSVLDQAIKSKSPTTFIDEVNSHTVGLALEQSKLAPSQNNHTGTAEAEAKEAVEILLENNQRAEENLPDDNLWQEKLVSLEASLTKFTTQITVDEQEATAAESESLTDEDTAYRTPLSSSTSSSDLPEEEASASSSNMSDSISFADSREAAAKEAIQALKNILTSEWRRPVHGGYFAGTRLLINNSPVQLPEGEAKIWTAIAQHERIKNTLQYPYYQLVGKIITIAVDAEKNKPPFGLRSEETSRFYSDMLDTLKVDIDASLASIRHYIERQNKLSWGTRFHERPTTVNKILSAIKDNRLDNTSKLKKAIQLANVASQSDNPLRSRNTDAFYHVFTSLLVLHPAQTQTMEPSDPPRKRRH